MNLSRQNAANKKTLATLTSRCDEQDKELKKLREDLGEMPGVKEKQAKCAELKERLVRTE